MTRQLSRELPDLDPPCLQNILKATHEHKHKSQLCMISLSKQSRPWRAIHHESRLTWIHLVFRNDSRHQWAYCTSSTCTCVWSDISNLHKQTEQTLIRQLSRELLYLDLHCLQKRFKVAARVYSTSSTCVWSDISYQTKGGRDQAVLTGAAWSRSILLTKEFKAATRSYRFHISYPHKQT